MKKVYLETFGCQMNVSDSERVATNLASDGYEMTADEASADVVAAAVKAAAAGPGGQNRRNADYEVFNLGESRTVELNELIALLEKELGTKATIDRQPAQPGDVPQTFADISKARALLGYNPQTQIEVGLHRFVEWFRTN